eukprot:TRINITY_DN84779_c0_g1_i1.p1 TRINITY_DN84779_c0_g1~~TRINITY_DN84779_c0_g1_i1.p1  ORF type:complete len:173 (-),score=50.77 TRINITY_DN84779_c0_g1_i1:186-704(-)
MLPSSSSNSADTSPELQEWRKRLEGALRRSGDAVSSSNSSTTATVVQGIGAESTRSGTEGPTEEGDGEEDEEEVSEQLEGILWEQNFRAGLLVLDADRIEGRQREQVAQLETLSSRLDLEQESNEILEMELQKLREEVRSLAAMRRDNANLQAAFTAAFADFKLAMEAVQDG